MIVDIRSSPNIPSHPSSAEPVRTGTYQYRYSYSYHLRTTAHQRCPVLVSVRVYKYATRTPVCRGAKCVRVPEISQHTRTGSYHRPNKTRGSYYAMTLLRVLHSYRDVPVPTFPEALLPYVQAPHACAYLKVQVIRVPVRTIIQTTLKDHITLCFHDYLYGNYEYCTRLRIMYRRHMRTVHQPFSRRVCMDNRSASAPPQTPRLAS